MSQAKGLVMGERGAKSFNKEFREGTFVFPEKTIENTEKYLEFLTRFKEIRANRDINVFLKSICFIKAFIIFINHEDVDFRRFLEKIKKHGAKIYITHVYEQAFKMLVDLYIYKDPLAKKIKFESSLQIPDAHKKRHYDQYDPEKPVFQF